MNGLPLFHLLISRVSIRFLTFIASQKHKHKSQQNNKVAAIYKYEKGIFFLYFSPESQNMQIIIWGKERREREKACVKKYLETEYLEILSVWHVTSVLYL